MSKRWPYMALAAAVTASFVLASPAQAEPASLGSGQDAGAFRTFGKFAKSWMAEMEQREQTNRARPTIEENGKQRFATYTGYAPEWNVEVHATGDRTSPWVGVLHYEEQTFTCRDATTRACSISRLTPVTEVFPYRDGSWKY
jgi:hypothetical protein